MNSSHRINQYRRRIRKLVQKIESEQKTEAPNTNLINRYERQIDEIEKLIFQTETK